MVLIWGGGWGYFHLLPSLQESGQHSFHGMRCTGFPGSPQRCLTPAAELCPVGHSGTHSRANPGDRQGMDFKQKQSQTPSELHDKALGMSTMPRPGCSNDRFQVILCLPSKLSLGLAAICPDGSRISWTPGSELDREMDPTDT